MKPLPLGESVEALLDSCPDVATLVGMAVGVFVDTGVDVLMGLEAGVLVSVGVDVLVGADVSVFVSDTASAAERLSALFAQAMPALTSAKHNIAVIIAIFSGKHHTRISDLAFTSVLSNLCVSDIPASPLILHEPIPFAE